MFRPIRLALVLLTASAGLVAGSGTGHAAAAEPSSAPTALQLALDDYVAALHSSAAAAAPWTQMDDYVRLLGYWHRHPGWGLG